ncbi:MAG: IMP dehydrogenase [archaeon]
MNNLPKDAFFETLSRIGLAVTYDDVELKTQYSKVMPDAVSTATRFSRNVNLNIPIVSAAMDTVTEADMAIELAKLGGIGVIHKNLSPEAQAAAVAKVKFHLNGLIEKPISFRETDTIASILAKKQEKRWTFSSFPVLNSTGMLVGILTDNDFDFCTDTTQQARQLMTTQLITSSPDTTIEQAYALMFSAKKKVLPLIDDKGLLAGMYVLSDVKRIMHPAAGIYAYNVDAHGKLRVAAAIGVYDDAFSRAEQLVKKADVLVIDTAHADSLPVHETFKKLKDMRLGIDIVIGNISEPDSARRLCALGVDGIKIGQGPGGICTTRVIAGIGTPQVTAIYECSTIAKEYGIPLCADGGLKYPGDIAKAIGAGAASVMMGGMLAGTKEAPGRIEFVEGRQWKVYRGMGSIGAMEEHAGSRQRYNQSGKEQLIAEGVEGLVPYKGELAEVIAQYVGSFRRSMGYVGAASVEELQLKADFRRVTDAGQKEAHPHEIRITREPPNYSLRH